MPVETPSLFAQVIRDHLELKERNSDLGPTCRSTATSPTIRSRTTRCSRPRSRPVSRRRWTASSRPSSRTAPRPSCPGPAKRPWKWLPRSLRRVDRGLRLLGRRSRPRLRLGRLASVSGGAGAASRRHELQVATTVSRVALSSRCAGCARMDRRVTCWRGRTRASGALLRDAELLAEERLGRSRRGDEHAGRTASSA